MRPPASAKHTGTACGRPSAVTVASRPTRACASRSAAVAGGKLGIPLEHLAGALVRQLEQGAVDAGGGELLDELVGRVGAVVADGDVPAGALAQLLDPRPERVRIGAPV